MAISEGLFTKGLRGMVGGTMVFKRVNGETVVSAAPQRGTNVPTIGQMAQRQKFRLASFYAIRATSDPALLAVYTAVGQTKGTKNLRAVMMADYFDSPEILTCKVEDNTLQPGTKILAILAISYVRVKSVSVSVIDPGGLVVEDGYAALGPDSQTWMYEFQNEANLIANVSFNITAISLPGNVTNRSFDYQG